MAVAIKANSIDFIKADSFSELPSELGARIDHPAVRGAPATQEKSPLEEIILDSIDKKYALDIGNRTSLNDQFTEIMRLVLQGELSTSVFPDQGLSHSRVLNAWASFFGGRSARFDAAYAKLGRWRLKGTDELRAAEAELIASKLNLRLLATKVLDEENIETFNHACWLLSREPFAAAGFLTAELLRRIAFNSALSADQWTNGLDALSGLPSGCLAPFLPSIMHILFAAAKEKDEDVRDALGELADKLPSENLKERIGKVYLRTNRGGQYRAVQLFDLAKVLSVK